MTVVIIDSQPYEVSETVASQIKTLVQESNATPVGLVRAEAASLSTNNFKTKSELSDYVTHHHDWVHACQIAKVASTNDADSSYWEHQLKTLANLKNDGSNLRGNHD